MKSILIVNLHSAQNAGDHALLQMSLADLRAHFPTHPIVLAANDPDSFRRAGQLEQVVPSFFYWTQGARSQRLTRMLATFWLLLCSILVALVYRMTGSAFLWPVPMAQRPSIQAYLDAELVASCPGNFLYSRSYQAGLPLLLTVYTIAYARLLDKPVVMLPQTIGPIRRRWERLILAWLLCGVDVVLVRDALSLTLLQKLGVPRNRCHLLADMAFQPPSDDQLSGIHLLQQFGIEPESQRPLLGVTAIDWGAQDPSFTGQVVYEAALADTIERFVLEQQGYAVIFAQVCGPKAADDDHIPARRIGQRLAEGPAAARVCVADGVFSAPALRAAYAHMDLLIGSRLHSNIFALSEGTPVLAIAYQIKTWGVMQMLGLEEWVIDIDQVDTEHLIALYQRIWPERHELQEIISLQVEKVIGERLRILHSVYEAMAALLDKEA